MDRSKESLVSRWEDYFLIKQKDSVMGENLSLEEVTKLMESDDLVFSCIPEGINIGGIPIREGILDGRIRVERIPAGGFIVKGPKGSEIIFS